MEDTTIAKAGKLICVEHGEFSDYSVIGFFVVLQDFDPMEKLKHYLTLHPKQNERYNFEKDMFLASLLAEGLLLEIDYGTFYLGAYGERTTINFHA